MKNFDLDGIVKKFKENPGMYGTLVVSVLIVLSFYISSIGAKGETAEQKRQREVMEKSVEKSKVDKEIINKDKDPEILKKEKLKASENPEARIDDLTKEQNKLKTDGDTLIKSKYNNTASPHKEEVISFEEEKKKEELKKKEKIEEDNKIKELEKKLQDKEKQLEIERKRKEAEVDKLELKKKMANPTPTSATLTPELRNILLSEALDPVEKETGNYSTVKSLLKVEIAKDINVTNKEEVVENKIRFNIVPGSSFHGRLLNMLYSGHTDSGAILKIENTHFKNCNFLGNVRYLPYKGLAVDINRVACEDGYVQNVNAKAFRITDLKPVFSDKVERHLFPKVVIGTLDALINMVRIDNNDYSANQDTGYLQANKTLVDDILKEELKRYQDEESVNPQSMVIIFY